MEQSGAYWTLPDSPNSNDFFPSPASVAGAAGQNVSFTASIDARRTLLVEGTDAAETIIAEVTGDPASIAKIAIDYRVTGGTGSAQKTSFRLDAFDRLVVNARGGADFVNIIDAAELLDTQKKILKLDGGNGDNVVVLSHLPFKPETAARMTRLLDLSKQIEDVAKRASEATAQALTSDAMKFIESVRANLVDASKSMADDAQSQLLGPARGLVERSGPQLVDLGNSIIAKSENLAKQHDALVAELTKKYDPTNGVFPPDDNREEPNTRGAKPPALPDPSVVEKEASSAQARAEQLMQAGLKLGADAKAEVERMGQQMQSDAAGIDQRAAEFEKRLEQLSTTAETLAARGEKDLTAAADRVLAVVAELKSLERNFQEAGMAVREELLLADSMRPAANRAKSAKAAAGGCGSPIITTHTYTGGSGGDIFFPFSAPWQSWSISGGAGNDLLFGGFVDDDIHGGPDNDVVCGLSGNDHIHGDDGTDLLCGEFFADIGFTGDDCIWGDDGIDVVVGDNVFETPLGTPGGVDELWGGKGTDIVVGDDVFPDIFMQNLPGGKDTIEGNDDSDALFGCGGDDKIDGNDDMDFAEGNGGDDIIDGGDGRNFSLCNTTIDFGNLLLGGWGDDTVTGGAGIDVIFGDRDNDTLTGKDQVDIEFGGSGKDVMYGDAGGTICVVSGIPIRAGNFMVGGDDDDKMWAGGDRDVMLGENDDDKIYGYDGSFQQPFAADADLLFGGPGNDYLEGDNEQPLLLFSTDFIFGGPGDDDMHGGNDIDFMLGEAGFDHMYGDSNALWLVASFDLMFGGSDGDWMDGGNGLDLMFGEGGNDTMFGDDETPGLISPDFMFGGPGADTMNGGCSFDFMSGDADADHMLGDSNYWWELLSSDLMFGGPGSDYMDGGNRMDFMFGGPGCDTMLGDNSTFGRLSPDFMFGDTENDDMDGGNGTDFMFGGAGNDQMIGDREFWWQFFSSDLMFGEDGCDTMFGGLAFDVMSGGLGVDQMDGQHGPDMMSGGGNSDIMNGGDSVDIIMGDDGNDLIHGDDFFDLILGGDGDDCLYGDNGPDVIVGGNGNDCLHGGSHVDFLFGNAGDDLIFGDNGSDALFGGPGDDKLDGGNAPDLLVGGAGGNDELWGGPGLDLLLQGEINHQSGSSGLDCNCQIEVCTGKICVHKFNDLNGDGIQNIGEPSLQGWVFQIAGNCAGGTLITDANGNACGDFFAGTYTVVEQLQGGWTATTPTTQTVTVTVGQTTNVSFGNKQNKGTLCVRKFNDLNANGIRDLGEPGLPNWSFTVTDSSGASTPFVTLSNGDVCQSLPVGTYTVVETPKSGWAATTPTTQTVTVSAGQTTVVSFGNTQGNGELCIYKFNDLNGNGVLDLGELRLANWTFTVTDSSGASTTVVTLAGGGICKGFPAGTYTVVETLKSGWTATTPTTQTVTVTAGQNTDVWFGNR